MQSEEQKFGGAQQKKIEQEEAQAAAEIDQWWAKYYASQNGGQSSSREYDNRRVTSAASLHSRSREYTHIVRFSAATRRLINRTNGKSISGAPIVAANGGKVDGSRLALRYGNYVMIDHGGGTRRCMPMRAV